MGDERGDDADQRRADVYSSARIGAAAALTLVLVVCVDCGACEPECPVSAIFPEDSVPPAWARYTEVNALWYQDREAARRLVDELRPAAS